MAAPLSHSTFSYRLLTWSLFPAALLYTIYIAIKYRNLDYLFQRLGIYPQSILSNRVVWCHCASVGEINTALPLLTKLADLGEQLVISTNTVTGREALLRAKVKNTSHIFLPLDYTSFAKRLIAKFSPRYCFIFETELWPNILHTTINQAIPVAIINGRISDKTLHAPLLLLKNYRTILSRVSRIVASSEENATRFAALGAAPNNIQTLDNLKFTTIKATQNNIANNPLPYSFLLCASTHPGEEQIIINQWDKIRKSNIGLVIAVRHPHRSKEICALLESNKIPYCLHSQTSNNASTNVASKEKVYIIDTLGELMPFMQHAALVFIGGSLVPIGGHNVIEPAQFNRCILIGPYHDDFKDIVNDLISHQGIRVVDNENEFTKTVIELLEDSKACRQLGENANSYLQSKKDVLSAYHKIVNEILEH